MFTRDSRPTKPGAPRPLGLEHLEQRTVLSASQIVVVALDAGSFPAGGPPQPEQPFSALVASAIQVLEQPRTWSLEVFRPTRHVEDASWLVGWRISQALDGVAMGQGALVNRHATRPGAVVQPTCGECVAPAVAAARHAA